MEDDELCEECGVNHDEDDRRWVRKQGLAAASRIMAGYTFHDPEYHAAATIRMADRFTDYIWMGRI